MHCKLTMSILVLICVIYFAVSPNADAAQRQPIKPTVTYSRVRGWEAALVQGAPNLANYYWEPMTRRTINTTATTGHQAIRAPLPVVKHNPVTSYPHRSSSPCTVASIGATARRLCSDSVATTDTALVYKTTTPSLATSTVSCALDVNAQLVNSKASGKLIPKHALIAHQLSLADSFGK